MKPLTTNGPERRPPCSPRSRHRLEDVEDGGAGLRVLKLGGETIVTRSATGKLILSVFAGFAQFEREMMLERQREGIAKAKAENPYMGRRPSERLKAEEGGEALQSGADGDADREPPQYRTWERRKGA